MGAYRYSTNVGEKDASAVGLALPISTKCSIEVCTFIRGKKVESAKAMLKDVIKEKLAVPYRRFTNGVGHRRGKGIAAGRYPKKVCGEILGIINSAQANAQFKGLAAASLVLRHISAQKASNTPHYGRKGRMSKRTTIEIVVTEAAENKAAPEKPKVGHKEGKAVE